MTLSIGGGIAAAAGGLVGAGADIGYYAVSKTKLADAKKAMAVDEEEQGELRKCGSRYDHLLQVLTKNPERSLQQQLKDFMKCQNGNTPTIVIASSRGVYYSFKVIDGGVEGIRVVRTTINVASKQALGLLGQSCTPALLE